MHFIHKHGFLENLLQFYCNLRSSQTDLVMFSFEKQSVHLALVIYCWEKLEMCLFLLPHFWHITNAFLHGTNLLHIDTELLYTHISAVAMVMVFHIILLVIVLPILWKHF